MASLKTVTLPKFSKYQTRTEYKGKNWTVIKKKSAKMQLLEKAALRAVKEFGCSYQACIGLTIFDILNLKDKIIIFPAGKEKINS